MAMMIMARKTNARLENSEENIRLCYLSEKIKIKTPQAIPQGFLGEIL